MKVRYTRQALGDLSNIQTYMAHEQPASSLEMGQRIRHAIESLAVFPDRGRIGRIQGTRELVVARSPFIAAYRVGPEFVDVLAILHGARQWPDSFAGVSGPTPAAAQPKRFPPAPGSS